MTTPSSFLDYRTAVVEALRTKHSYAASSAIALANSKQHGGTITNGYVMLVPVEEVAELIAKHEDEDDSDDPDRTPTVQVMPVYLDTDDTIGQMEQHLKEQERAKE